MWILISSVSLNNTEETSEFLKDFFKKLAEKYKTIAEIIRGKDLKKVQSDNYVEQKKNKQKENTTTNKNHK